MTIKELIDRIEASMDDSACVEIHKEDGQYHFKLWQLGGLVIAATASDFDVALELFEASVLENLKKYDEIPEAESE